MLTESEALEKILAKVRPLAIETVSLRRSTGRFVASDLVATVPSPPFDNSAMDGFALAFDGAAAPADTRFRVIGTQAAGPDAGLTLTAGEAARIFTGAPIPTGTSGVVMQEDTRLEADAVVLTDSCARDEFIRRAGADVCRGQRILTRGDAVTPARAGLLASQGLAGIEVHAAPRVAIISTGDELVPSGQSLAAGQIYESNGVLLAALVESTGAIVADVKSVRDDPVALEAALRAGLDSADVVIISGGVSVGERDYVKPTLGRIGVDADFWRVAVKPGKPFLLGQATSGAFVFGLPGNPVSSFVTFLLFARPALRRMMGAAVVVPATQLVRADVALANPDARPHYVRGRIEAGFFRPEGRQESHAFFGLSRSDALVRVAAGGAIAAGGWVEAIAF